MDWNILSLKSILCVIFITCHDVMLSLFEYLHQSFCDSYLVLAVCAFLLIDGKNRSIN